MGVVKLVWGHVCVARVIFYVTQVESELSAQENAPPARELFSCDFDILDMNADNYTNQTGSVRLFDDQHNPICPSNAHEKTQWNKEGMEPESHLLQQRSPPP